MKHIGLFEGIGGFSLAARWMGWETVAWCEWNEFGQKVLRHHFPEAEGFGDITKTDFTKYANRIDILTGGFPCQPYSLAGKRKGKEDDRHLWPEMLRAIREIRPSWVVGENVFGLINWNGGMVFDEAQTDLEAEGYEVWAYVLPACAVNAPHKRERIWFVAYRNKCTKGSSGKSREIKSIGAKTMMSRNNGEERPNSIIDHMNFYGILPTPTGMDATNATANMKSSQVKQGSMHSMTLTRLLCTPTAQASRGNTSDKRGKGNLTDQIAEMELTTGKTSQLNPRFVAEMMGFPPNWTELPFQNGETKV
jgi:DNA-cytosine methyltransferase